MAVTIGTDWTVLASKDVSAGGYVQGTLYYEAMRTGQTTTTTVKTRFRLIMKSGGYYMASYGYSYSGWNLTTDSSDSGYVEFSGGQTYNLTSGSATLTHNDDGTYQKTWKAYFKLTSLGVNVTLTADVTVPKISLADTPSVSLSSLPLDGVSKQKITLQSSAKKAHRIRIQFKDSSGSTVTALDWTWCAVSAKTYSWTDVSMIPKMGKKSVTATVSLETYSKYNDSSTKIGSTKTVTFTMSYPKAHKLSVTDKSISFGDTLHYTIATNSTSSTTESSSILEHVTFEFKDDDGNWDKHADTNKGITTILELTSEVSSTTVKDGVKVKNCTSLIPISAIANIFHTSSVTATVAVLTYYKNGSSIVEIGTSKATVKTTIDELDASTDWDYAWVSDQLSINRGIGGKTVGELTGFSGASDPSPEEAIFINGYSNISVKAQLTFLNARDGNVYPPKNYWAGIQVGAGKLDDSVQYNTPGSTEDVTKDANFITFDLLEFATTRSIPGETYVDAKIQYIDPRGISSGNRTVTVKVVPYFGPLLPEPEAYRADPTQNAVTISATGTMFTNSFGAITNRIVAAKLYYKERGTSTWNSEDIPPSIAFSYEDGGVTLSYTTNVLDRNKIYDVYVEANDYLESCKTKTIKIYKYVPIFSYGESLFGADQNHFDVYGKLLIHDQTDANLYTNLDWSTWRTKAFESGSYDLDDLKGSTDDGNANFGVYSFTEGTTLANAPDGNTNGVLMVIPSGSFGSGGIAERTRQIWFREGLSGTNDSDIYSRSYGPESASSPDYNSWSNWYRLHTTDMVSQNVITDSGVGCAGAVTSSSKSIYFFIPYATHKKNIKFKTLSITARQVGGGYPSFKYGSSGGSTTALGSSYTTLISSEAIYYQNSLSAVPTVRATNSGWYVTLNFNYALVNSSGTTITNNTPLTVFVEYEATVL